MILAKPVPDPAHGVIRFEGPVVSQAAQVIDQLEQFGPAVAAGLLRWKVGFTAGFLPSRFPGFVSQRNSPGTARLSRGYFAPQRFGPARL